MLGFGECYWRGGFELAKLAFLDEKLHPPVCQNSGESQTISSLRKEENDLKVLLSLRLTCSLQRRPQTFLSGIKKIWPQPDAKILSMIGKEI